MEAAADFPPGPKIRVVHLADHSGRLQVLFPEDNMLDISAISRITKRRLEPIPNFDSAGDPLIQANSMMTILESNILDQHSVSIRTTKNSQYKAFSHNQLRDIFTGPFSRFEQISINIADIPKPVANHEDDEEQIFHALSQFQSIRLKQRLEETLEIPPLSITSQRILRLSSDESAGMDELCEVIALDPSLAAQVVSWASSPYYGAPGSIESVEDAIIRVLGYDMVMNLALGLSMKSAFQLPEEGPRHYENFWLGSVTNASLMASLVEKISIQDRPKLGHAYLSGLLQNFGFLAISSILPPHFSILSRYQEANAHLPSEIIEMQTLHFTKEQLGSWLLRYWSLPDNIWTAIRYSKQPHYYGEHATLAKLLYITNCIRHSHDIEPSVLQEVGLTLDAVEACQQDLLQSSSELHRMAAFINKTM